MFVLVVGGGKVGYYSPRTERIRHESSSWRRTAGGPTRSPTRSLDRGGQGRLRGDALAEAGRTVPTWSRRSPATTRTTRHLPDGQASLRRPKTIARVNNPKNEPLFKHLGVDELISPTRMILGSIEQDIRPRAAPPAPCRAISSSSRPSSTRARRRSAAIRGTSTSRTAARSWRSSGPTWPRRSAPTRSCGPATGSSPPAARNASRPSTSRSSGPPRRAEPRPRRLSACSVSLQLSACMG